MVNDYVMPYIDIHMFGPDKYVNKCGYCRHILRNIIFILWMLNWIWTDPTIFMLCLFKLNK